MFFGCLPCCGGGGLCNDYNTTLEINIEATVSTSRDAYLRYDPATAEEVPEPAYSSHKTISGTGTKLGPSLIEFSSGTSRIRIGPFRIQPFESVGATPVFNGWQLTVLDGIGHQVGFAFVPCRRVYEVSFDFENGSLIYTKNGQDDTQDTIGRTQTGLVVSGIRPGQFPANAPVENEGVTFIAGNVNETFQPNYGKVYGATSRSAAPDSVSLLYAYDKGPSIYGYGAEVAVSITTLEAIGSDIEGGFFPWFFSPGYNPTTIGGPL